jgi:segregation and condensation protein B
MNLQRSTEPARQLQSVSQRYAGPLPRATVRGNFQHALPGLAAAKDRSVDATAAPSPSPLARDPAMARLEAVLFLAREPLASRKLSQYANLADGTQARTLVRRLNELYDAAGRAFRVEQVAGGYQLLSRRKFAPWLRRLAHVPGETRLSAPALETLAVIAYRQPVPRADIEAIRGVNCGEILRQLLERDLIRIGGRSEELGRPYLYLTTRRFLQLFGLTHLEELPRGAELRNSPLPSAPPTIPHPAEDTEPTSDESDPWSGDEFPSGGMNADDAFDAADHEYTEG